MQGRSRLPPAGIRLTRRHFIAALSVATLSGVGLSRCSFEAPQRLATAAEPVAATSPKVLPPPPRSARIQLPGGMLSILPGDGDLLALTVDDGVNSEVLRAYTQFAKDTGVRLTYFVNGIYPSWTDHVELLRPLVDDGQIQLANHTWSHPNLTRLPLDAVAEELRHNHDFLWKTYGVDARPYFRSPYGARNAHVEKVAGELGYTTDTMWSGDLKDHAVVPESEIVRMAEEYFTPQAIVIGHLNHLPVTNVYRELVEIIRARELRTVTLDDVFLRPGGHE